MEQNDGLRVGYTRSAIDGRQPLLETLVFPMKFQRTQMSQEHLQEILHELLPIFLQYFIWPFLWSFRGFHFVFLVVSIF
ncbi:transmembrane protein, putative [Medicago truncatula]|uniref:Transmembrane protein, putative n=1 Tax=Medicago truncatula TaxID=3880 RepID=G7KD93_MEDTR|nr:transmembrane protein, putative [Medicago truncatula]